ncbi:MAG TPA: sigma factor-like helix-turn-helix DNA-binding protein [Bryobacteraceae bacterium]|nr:sigma factor-like helix-turn-helix DNA-binding protein [Bryobacteraceae bacterium]
MAYFWDSRNDWINSWAARHVEERPGEAFPRDAAEFWDTLDTWILKYSYWAVRSNHLSLDPVELAERIGDRILSASDTFRGEATLTTWLQKLGFHEMLSIRKLKQYTNTSYLEDELRGRGEDMLPENHGSNFELFGGDPASIVGQTLAQLPNQRAAEIVHLQRIEGWTDLEIAAKFNLTRGAVHQTIARAMRQLRSFANGGVTARKKVQRARVKRAAS